MVSASVSEIADRKHQIPSFLLFLSVIEATGSCDDDRVVQQETSASIA